MGRGPRSLICPCGSAERAACAIPSSLTPPAKQTHRTMSTSDFLYVVPLCNQKAKGQSVVLPYCALVFCEEHWLFLHEHVGWGCPPSEPSLPCEARLQSLPEDPAGTCPDGYASPAAAIDNHTKKKKKTLNQSSHHRGGYADQNMSTCSQAIRLQRSPIETSCGCPEGNKASSVSISSLLHPSEPSLAASDDRNPELGFPHYDI